MSIGPFKPTERAVLRASGMFMKTEYLDILQIYGFCLETFGTGQKVKWMQGIRRTD
jgi:hypothetical protein